MHPIFLRLDSFEIHWYGICMAVGFLLFLWTLRHFGRGTRRNSNYVSNLLTLLIVFGLGGARAAYVIEHWSAQFARSPWQVLNLHQGGLMFYGGLIGAWLAMTAFALWHRENYLDFLDFLVTALPIGHAAGRVGCFLEGCCFGARTDGPLGVVYPIGSHAWSQQVAEGLIGPACKPLPLYPSQLFEAALLLVIYAALFWHYRRRRRPGGQVAIYAMSYAAVRFVIEMFRSDVRAHVGMFTISQFISLLLFLFGLAMAVYVWFPRRGAGAAARTALLLVLAAHLTGCASSKVAEEPQAMPPVFRSVRPDNLPPDFTYQVFTNRAVRAPLPPKKTLQATPEGPVSKEWKVQLALGQRKAQVNGVELWLCEPAVAAPAPKPAKGAKPAKGDKAKARVVPTEADRMYTLGPLLHAPTNAYVRAERPPRVMIDPGHGGSDPGTTRGKTRESAIALDIARRLSSYLALSGFDVRITRPNDKTSIGLEDRCLLAAAWPADLFVSIHLNSGPAAANGVETYAIPPVGQLSTEAATRGSVKADDREAAKKSEAGNAHDEDNIRLAWCVHRRLVAATARKDRGIRRARFSVLRESSVPAVLVEVGFLSNESDAGFLTTVAGREKAAIGLCRGIMDFCAGHISPKHPALPIGTEATPASAPSPAAQGAQPKGNATP